MNLLGTHKVSFSTVRSLAVQCYALDAAAYLLLLDSTHTDKSGKTKATYEELFTGQLLALAIALRTKCYQGLDHKNTVRYVSAAGLLYKYNNCCEETLNFSIKDVCDKIIHADTVSRYLEPGVPHPTTTFCGKDNRDKSTWEFSMSVTLFVEGVLEWLQDAEKI